MGDLKQNINSYLTRLKNGEDCFDEFFEYTSGYIEAVAYRYLTDKSHTDDVVGITYKAVYYNLDKYDCGRNGFAWMYEIAKNEALRMNERNAKYLPLYYKETAAVSDGAADNYLEKYDLHIAISKLSEEEQSLLDLVIFKGIKMTKVAKMKRLDYWTVYRQIGKIYKKLKEFLE